MSTPYVGLKQVFGKSKAQGATPWTQAEAGGATPELTQTGDYRREVKRRLLQVLDQQLGVMSIQVGAFQMRLTPDVPDRHLVKATHYLIQQLKEESEPSPHVETLESCLVSLLRS